MYLEFDYAFWFEIHSGRRHYYARPCFCRTEPAAAAENNFMAKAASASRPPVLKTVPRRCHLEEAPLPVDKGRLEAIPLPDSGTTLVPAKTPAGCRKQEAARLPAAAGQPPVAFIAYFFRYCPSCGLGLHDLHTVEITLEQYSVLYEQQSVIVNACRRERQTLSFFMLDDEQTASADCFSQCELLLNLRLLLTPCQRRRLLLYAAGYTYEEIARREECAVSKIHQSIKRARKNLLLHINDTTEKYF